MRMSHSADEAQGLERKAPRSTRLSLAFPAARLHIYIQTCHYLCEVTGKDSMIYQTGRQAASPELLLDGGEEV